ncbi:ECD [Bugula neritina]|uniref:ECD n=1 Tax=Bugula neritina TaxID=10212 RepID=A0A7J7J4N3_BUGNE|nr:ECD [Bugula neritina]
MQPTGYIFSYIITGTEEAPFPHICVSSFLVILPQVYLYKGELHIIPQRELASQSQYVIPEGIPSVSAAVECIRQHPDLTKADPKVQQAINRRLSRYPEQAFKEIHSTTCYLPVPAALILSQCPQLVSAATSAFYLRDPIDLKSCQTMKHFPPENRVNAKVRLTRCLYAQLVQQKFFPPKRSSWNIPSASSPKHKSHDLGMKISFGLEILCAGASSSTKTHSTDMSSLVEDSRWHNYLCSLKKYNYFEGEIEGSIKYKELLGKAKEYFLSSRELSSSEEQCSNSTRMGQQILSHLENTQLSEQYLRELEKNLTPDDDDSWLYLTCRELDEMLEEYQESGLGDSGEMFDPSSVTHSMDAFINKQSNILTGAKFPADSDIKFDDRGFLAAIEKMMNGQESQSDDSSLDEYDSDDSLPQKQEKSRLKNPQSSKAHLLNKSSASGSSSSSQDKAKVNGQEPTVEDFMEMMDRELMRTNVGKSFEKASALPKYDSSMKNKAALAEEESTDLDDSLEAVDVDFNTVKNLLESYNQQMGLPGPTSNLLESMGVKLPHNTDD